MAELKPLMDRVGYLVMTSTPLMEVLLAQHTRIAQAVNDRDSLSAEENMRAHLREILRPLPDLVRQYPDLFTD
jgi:DNA-binding GntR family transcriptional regulator